MLRGEESRSDFNADSLLELIKRKVGEPVENATPVPTCVFEFDAKADARLKTERNLALLNIGMDSWLFNCATRLAKELRGGPLPVSSWTISVTAAAGRFGSLQ